MEMTELVRIAGVLVIALVMTASLRVIADLCLRGVGRVREVREEGGGVLQKATGELAGGQRASSTARAHGLHMAVRGGRVEYREKSVIAKEVA